jgi:hypothetical protein
LTPLRAGSTFPRQITRKSQARTEEQEESRKGKKRAGRARREQEEQEEQEETGDWTAE